MIQNSIWSNKYKLNRIIFSENVSNSVIEKVIEKEFTKKNKSLKNAYVSLNSHNGLIIQNNKLPEDQILNKTTVLDMYNSNQETELIANIKESEDYLCLAKDNTSPELFRQKNPFIKRVSNLTTSPSVLSNGNCRKKGRNLMRIRRTIIDENTVVESKYFLKQDNKEQNVTELKNKEIEINSKNTKHNTIPHMDTSVHDINLGQLEKTLSITDIAQNASLKIENIDDAISIKQNDCLTDNYRNIAEKSNSNYKINDVSLVTHSMINNSYISDNSLVSSSSSIEANNTTNYENANSLQNNLSKWSDMEKDEIPKRNILKKHSSTNQVYIFIYLFIS